MEIITDQEEAPPEIPLGDISPTNFTDPYLLIEKVRSAVKFINWRNPDVKVTFSVDGRDYEFKTNHVYPPNKLSTPMLSSRCISSKPWVQ